MAAVACRDFEVICFCWLIVKPIVSRVWANSSGLSAKLPP